MSKKFFRLREEYLREEYGDLTSKRIIIGKVAQMKPTDAIMAV